MASWASALIATMSRGDAKLNLWLCEHCEGPDYQWPFASASCLFSLGSRLTSTHLVKRCFFLKNFWDKRSQQIILQAMKISCHKKRCKRIAVKALGEKRVEQTSYQIKLSKTIRKTAPWKHSELNRDVTDTFSWVFATLQLERCDMVNVSFFLITMKPNFRRKLSNLWGERNSLRARVGRKIFDIESADGFPARRKKGKAKAIDWFMARDFLHAQMRRAASLFSTSFLRFVFVLNFSICESHKNSQTEQKPLS